MGVIAEHCDMLTPPGSVPGRCFKPQSQGRDSSLSIGMILGPSRAATRYPLDDFHWVDPRVVEKTLNAVAGGDDRDARQYDRQSAPTRALKPLLGHVLSMVGETRPHKIGRAISWRDTA